MNSAQSTSETARQVHQDVEGAIRSRRTEQGTLGRSLEDRVKSAGGAVWRVTKRHPFVASAALGALGVAGAAAVGVAELALGGALAFATYKVLREGEPPLQALEEVERQLPV